MTAKWSDVKAQAEAVMEANGTLRTPEQKAADQAHLQAVVRAYHLAEIRKEQHLTQTQVAAAMGTGQNNVSRLERGELGCTEVDTLRRYVEALGGRLRIIADFGDRQYDAASC
ncbi:helix-turn-helix domain-containing protein [Phaeacidiphilus oryzae]|uniref:helix-turn-helix domain-containing protein n=1 Tax=Phaeacidiphilus oryzae TaxID=348818 RepID=UPI00055A02DF|nr:helix-turn-helix domain-containing protein [Phaeacidiphilus oryzae]